MTMGAIQKSRRTRPIDPFSPMLPSKTASILGMESRPAGKTSEDLSLLWRAGLAEWTTWETTDAACILCCETLPPLETVHLEIDCLDITCDIHHWNGKEILWWYVMCYFEVCYAISG